MISAQSEESYSLLWTVSHGWNVTDVSFSPDGRNVLAVESNTSKDAVKLYDAATGEIVWSATSGVRFGRFSPDMKKVFISGVGTAALDFNDGSLLWSVNYSSDCMALSNDGSMLALGKEIDRSHGVVRVLNIEDGSLIWEGATKGPVKDIEFTSDDSKIVSGGGDLSDKEVIMWNSSTGQILWTFLSGAEVQTVSISPEGNYVFVGTYWKQVYMLNAVNGNKVWEKTLIERVLDSGFTPDGKNVFFSSNNGFVRVYDAQTGGIIWEKDLEKFTGLRQIRISPDAGCLVSGSGDGYVYFFDVSTGELLSTMEIGKTVMCLNYSYDGTRIVVGTYAAGSVNVYQEDGAVNIESEEPVLNEYILSQNYPNPFNPTTTISYNISKTVKVRLSVYDALGREVKELVNELKTPGSYNVEFDGTGLASGIYFYRIETEGRSKVKSMLLMK
jgi:WD40 repeat protein